MKIIFSLFALFFTFNSAAQTVNPYPPTPAEKRLEAFNQRQKLKSSSLLKNVKLRSIGPTVMSGRVVDVDVSPADPTIFYVAYASGGLWKTTNNGISFTPLFDNQPSITIGDIAVDWTDDEIIWVGTGENNSSRSSYSGTGIFKSTDGGKSFTNMGLSDIHHTGRIIIHPNNPDIIWVAALGHLYSPNKQRGIYKTTDGGKSWRNTLFVNENTGAIDLVIDSKNPDILYAAFWEKTRRAWDFQESGDGSGIYKSTDGGENWFLISSDKSGFPTGNNIGRIGLSVFNKNPNIIYAVVDNQNHRKEKQKTEFAVNKKLLKEISVDDFLKLDDEDINEFLDRNDFPEKYSAAEIKEQIKSGKIKPLDLVEYLGDANEQLFDTPVIGAEVYRSDNGGITWKKTNDDFIDDMFYSYGYYFGEIRVDPNDENLIYLLGVPAIKSTDGGKTFSSMDESNVHGDHHALWINPDKNGHLILGNDGGLNISYDNGKTWFKANTPAVGQFYAVNVDMEKPYNVYGGLQDNGVWYGPSTNKPGYRWYASGHNPFKMIMGGDGMQVAIDTTDNNTVYTGFQFGYYYRIDKKKESTKPVRPQHKLGEKPLRFNWQTPIHLSKHNNNIFYIGSNFLHRSFDRGDNYETISGDLTKGKKDGDVPFGTLTTIDESPLKFGLLYTGSDDGLVYVSKDAGNSWKKISDNLPQNLWVSRVIASSFDTSVVYVSLNGYRWDNFDSYLFKSSDYGNTWLKLGGNLPAEPINVVREDPVNKNILYVGTDNGLYVSLDGGNSFMSLFNGLPDVPVHDLVIHPRDNEIVVGTHGRSVYIGDVSYIQKLTPDVLNEEIKLFALNNKTYSDRWGNKSYTWGEMIVPEFIIPYYAKTSGLVKIKILTDKNDSVIELTDTAEAGLNFFNYDLSVAPGKIKWYENFINENLSVKQKNKFKETDSKKVYLRPGKYSVEITANGNKQRESFEIKKAIKKQRGKKAETQLNKM